MINPWSAEAAGTKERYVQTAEFTPSSEARGVACDMRQIGPMQVSVGAMCWCRGRGQPSAQACGDARSKPGQLYNTRNLYMYVDYGHTLRSTTANTQVIFIIYRCHGSPWSLLALIRSAAAVDYAFTPLRTVFRRPHNLRRHYIAGSMGVSRLAANRACGKTFIVLLTAVTNRHRPPPANPRLPRGEWQPHGEARCIHYLWSGGGACERCFHR